MVTASEPVIQANIFAFYPSRVLHRRLKWPIIRKLSEILIKMADDPEVKEIMRRAGADTVFEYALVKRAIDAGTPVETATTTLDFSPYKTWLNMNRREHDIRALYELIQTGR